MAAIKPLNGKAYGSIGHLPESRLGTGDHHVSPGQAKICTEKCRPGDRIIVQEKLDGSCVSVAKIGYEIVPIVRSGYKATASPYLQHHYFAHWVREKQHWFDSILEDGERIVGEWLSQVHGTHYDLWHEPFVPFDLMRHPHVRATFDEFVDRVRDYDLTLPYLVADSGSPILVKDAMAVVEAENHHGSLEPIEGVVYRVERQGKVDFLAKYVRHDKIDGQFMHEDQWNWKPMPG